jgi:predicted nucleic acid-binding protein
VSRGYLDANYLYAHFRQPRRTPDPRVAEWGQRVLNELDGDGAVISALVIDELVYRMLLAWLGDDGHSDPVSTYRKNSSEVTRSMRVRLQRAWNAIDTLHLELAITDQRVVDRARNLLVDPGLAPRDAFHAAHAFESRCQLIVSSDSAFDKIAGLVRLGPLASPV